MASFKGANIEQDFMFVDEDGNPIESSGENLIYVDEAGREIPAEKATRMLESGEYIDTRVLYEDKSKKKAFNNMAGEARVRDQIRDEIVAKAYQLSLIKDPNALARNRAEEQAFLKINKVKYDDQSPQVNHNQLPPQQPRANQQLPPQHVQQHQPPRVINQQRQRADDPARLRAEEQARHKAQQQQQQQQQHQQSRLRPDERARIEEHMKQQQQQNAFARNRSRSTEQSYAQQQAQMRSRNATPITPMRLERSSSRTSNNRNKENFMNQHQPHQQQQHQQQNRSSSRPNEQGKSKEDMLHLLKSQLLKKQQEFMPPQAEKVPQNSKPHQPLRRDNSKILVNKNATYY